LKKTSFFLFFCLSLNVFSQTPKTLLWEISGNGLKNPSFLFGTYHLITSSYIDSFPMIRDRFEKTKGLVGEMLIDETTIAKVGAAVLMTDSSLTQLLSESDYKLVAACLKEISGMNLILFDKVKPVVVSTFFYASLLADTKGKAMDIYFQDIAKEEGKRVIGLETVEEQIAVLFDGNPLKQQAQQLVLSVKEKDKNREEVQQTNYCYRMQDLDCLSKFLNEGVELTPAVMDKLLYDRNRKWMLKLPDLMKEQGLFVAVGAGHLPGEKGLLNLLIEKGFTVRPVMMR
jgi:uncharacterized protein YbaP (TraB family)